MGFLIQSLFHFLLLLSVQKLSKPYGVIGPLCNQGNERILTHDFTTRLHMEIFEMNYYPPELVDWWMDDWISLGKAYSFSHFLSVFFRSVFELRLFPQQQFTFLFLFVTLLASMSLSISLLVYGKERTFKAKSVPVMHHTGMFEVNSVRGRYVLFVASFL